MNWKKNHDLWRKWKISVNSISKGKEKQGMDFSRLCINCMKEKEPEQNICPHCHFDQSTYVLSPYVLTPYTVLNGRYLVGKVLGKGGFGITYIAMDMMLERVVAIKEFFVQGYMYRDNSTSTSISVSTSAGDSQEQYYRVNREKFEREAKIIAHLDGLNGIVKVYDFFYENDTVYMVLEYLDGINLKEYVKIHGGKLNTSEVISKLDCIMVSVQKLHEHGILHRDISPDNIMVLGDGSLKLLDFGGAKIQANTGLSNMVIAKKGYTPIEQYHTDGNQGVWTDVYAMAATIYFCITGKVPDESICRVEKDTLKKPSEEQGVFISKKQEAVLMKGMAVKSQDRYHSMEEFRRELMNSGKNLGITEKGGFKNKKIIIGAAAFMVILGGGIIAGFAGAKSRQPFLDVRSIPERLDRNTVFTKQNPLVLKGRNLSDVDSLYLDNKKIENLKIIEKSDKELKVAFSVSGETGDISFYAMSHFMGIFSSSSAKSDIEFYHSKIKAPEITELIKNGKSINDDSVRMREEFTLGIKGNNLSKNMVIYINGENVKVSNSEENTLNVQINEKLIKKINHDKKIKVQLCPKTKEGYETTDKSNLIETKVYEMLIDNSWLNGFQGDVKQIVNITGIDNTKEAVHAKLDDLYNQGVRFVKFNQGYGIELQNIVDYIKNRNDMHLLVDISQGTDLKNIYDILNKGGIIESTIAVVDKADTFTQWSEIDKSQNKLKILFRLNHDDMTFRQSLDYFKEYNIRAVCFSTESYWNSTELRNRDLVKENNFSFFCEDAYNDEEIDYLLNPGDYTDNGEELQGITGFITTARTPEKKKQGQAALDKAKYFRDATDGSGMKDYLKVLKNSGYTVMLAVKDDGQEIGNIAAELDELGIHSEILGAPEAFRNSYVAVVKTHTDGQKPQLVMEKSKSSEDGNALSINYKADNGREFHLTSNGRKDNNDNVSPVAEISCGGQNYAPNQAGLNIVVYDENGDCIIDRIWYDSWNNRENNNPPISKNHGKEWVLLKDLDKKENRKQKIIDFFNRLGEDKDDYLIIMAVGDDGSSNMDADIQEAMSHVGVTAKFDSDTSFQKSYVGLFANDLGKISYTNGTNDEFSDMKISLKDFEYEGHKFDIVSEGNGLEDAIAQIAVDDQKMTNEQRGLHILVYDKKLHQVTNYSWIDCYDNLKFNSINLMDK